MTSEHTIVIIEDDAETADLYRKEIEDRGIGRVEVLLEAAEIFTPERLRTRLANASIVVLDIAMKLPEDISDDGTDGGLFAGCKVLKGINDDFPTLQVICLSNLAQAQFDAASKRLGVAPAKIHSKFDMPPAEFASFLASLLP